MRAQALAHEITIDRVDLEALDKFLMSDRAPQDSMMLSELDGFLTGIAIGPELVRPSEWLPLIWGGEAPEFANLDEANAILGSIMARYNEILREIADHALAPIFWVDRNDRSSPRTGLKASSRPSSCVHELRPTALDADATSLLARSVALPCWYGGGITSTMMNLLLSGYSQLSAISVRSHAWPSSMVRRRGHICTTSNSGSVIGGSWMARSSCSAAGRRTCWARWPPDLWRQGWTAPQGNGRPSARLCGGVFCA
jgi:Uncharacterised protein family (UPF0149)